ncbi:phosphoribosylaminoimidazolesuccinocarboxamide synthase [Neorickettsia sennetsu]|uniref:Phosphoribosylaminoimidazole-succinocarboxamide synthase n=1 Tax=Ehrlichia sennetsu (strain ATCC VR-367 / Miyayama) TaxID=222891 RepID=PUR7_EHRS3|nr:phosphoribosylaminoimidazolesuccinocarboxamide synthase [Neorickettsia sennetsu]Q2GCS7.1 RecName: Full=Phosphoribosylaminoimidazole-succinocarboxamide synthase; AltName: Full=SAICAR synthetase [Neorickettsia sennetsu str. Miyayama]ABD45892.1 phosphoribosylaminoimidazole-succinocarboxamide synthase [Neorickettsia sennetsu str. Miyayama]
MRERRKIYEGKAKILFSFPDNPNLVTQHFKDDVTAYNNRKHSVIPGKGVINNYISAFFMQNLQNVGIKTHFVKVLNMREQLVKKAELIPIEVVIRNIVAGGLAKRLGLEEGMILDAPLIETYYKSDSLGDPMVTDDHILSFNWLKLSEIEEMKVMAWRINDFLSGALSSAGIILVDLKLEFGFYDDQIILIDEISPDTCRFWDTETKEKMDKDRFRRDLGGVSKYYREVARRLGILNGSF